MNTIDTSEIFRSMKELMAGNEGLSVPPVCFTEMGGRIIEYSSENKTARIAFPIYERYGNPAGYMFGGMICAAFDNTIGPLSYLLAKKPTVSLDMNVIFIKQVKIGGELTVTAAQVKKSKRFIILEGKAYDSGNELVATATSRMLILDV